MDFSFSEGTDFSLHLRKKTIFFINLPCEKILFIIDFFICLLYNKVDDISIYNSHEKTELNALNF